MNVTDSASDLAAALRRRDLSAGELLEATIDRAEHVAAELNPIAVRLYDRARDAAARADRQLAAGSAGPLCGLPVTIKDSQFLAGVPCANGSHSLTEFVPTQSSRAIQRLEAAGAVIFAKTTCPEFSLFGVTESELYGVTRNPWHPERTAGGSSGGAGVAVAAGLGPLSLGGDGGGSIRIPSAFCGIVGFKPTFGAIDREPCFPAWKSLVCYGPMARSVEDASTMYRVMAGGVMAFGGAESRVESLVGKRIVVSEDLGFAPVDSDVRESFRRLVDRLADAGAHIIEDCPGLPSSVETWAVTATYDAWKHHEEPHYEDSVGHFAQAFMEFGSRFGESRFRAAQAERQQIAGAYRRMYERTGARLFLTPTLGCEAFPHGQGFPESIGDTSIELPWTDWAGFLYDANLTGNPACAMPMGQGDDHLPVSVQVAGPAGADREVLDLAAQIEVLVDWHYPFANGTAHPRFS